MKTMWKIAAVVVVLAGVNLLVRPLRFRIDMTDDQRYSLSEPTKNLLRSMEAPLEVTILLEGKMNASFLNLRDAAVHMSDEMRVYGKVKTLLPKQARVNELAEQLRLTPVVIHERAKDGQTVQTRLYPYAVLRYGEKTRVVPLLVNERGRSGEENVNRSIEQLEFAYAEAVSAMKRAETPKIAFLEGHGELAEEHVLDVEQQLANYFQVDRGSLNGEDGQLDGYRAVVIADPQRAFSEADKYLLDQYVMRGGRVLWALNGVQFSDDYLATEGTTPVIAQDLNVQDMLFRYGVRVEPALVQDLQCLPIPVDVSEDPSAPNFQPLPWTYAPLLLSSEVSPVTAKLGQVSATFCSPVSAVGDDENIHREVLLATSSHSALTATPAQVDLSDLNPDASRFVHRFIPVAVLTEGVFPSLFAHQMLPEGVVTTTAKRAESEPTRQIVIGAGSVIRNEWQQGQPLPCGYDRYTQMQFANRDFIVNSVLYLTDDEGLIPLRQKSVTLRLLNDQNARENRLTIQLLTTLLPLLLLGLVAAIYIPIRKHKFTYTT